LKSKATFKQGVEAKVQLKSNIPIDAKVEMSPKGFTLGVKAELEFFFNLPQFINNVELYDLVLAPRLKKDTNQFGQPICNPLGQFSHIY
jgi:hypothetical protein